jgi:hypothetical protein
VFVPQNINKDNVSCDIPKDEMLDLVLKFLWLRSGSENIESKLLKECGGMFGVVKHYHSCMLCYKPGVKATNNLLLPEEAEAIDKPKDGEKGAEKDLRGQWMVVLHFAGELLVKARTPIVLMKSVMHAILGDMHLSFLRQICANKLVEYRNMIHKGLQYRDTSMGNVLFSKKPVDISSAVKDLEGLNAPE